jgi:hypothetical protein
VNCILCRSTLRGAPIAVTIGTIIPSADAVLLAAADAVADRTLELMR